MNPYVAGNPVIGELFVGREDIFRRLEELWAGSEQKPSIVLYGHRRMGKSSILHNLGARAMEIYRRINAPVGRTDTWSA